MSERGFFGIGIYKPKAGVNVGTLWRSAHAFGANMTFQVGSSIVLRQASDTTKAHRHVPHQIYDSIDDLIDHLPYGCPLIGVELDERARCLSTFKHPERAFYLLGREDIGLPPDVIDRCAALIQIPGASRCLNVASAGSIVLYDRIAKALEPAPTERGA